MLKVIQAEVTEDAPTSEVEAFFKLLKVLEEPLHEASYLRGSNTALVDYPVLSTRGCPRRLAATGRWTTGVANLRRPSSTLID
jgi:hypothetical protein